MVALYLLRKQTPPVFELRYPAINIEGKHHDPPEPKPTIAAVVYATMAILLSLIAVGDRVCEAVGISVPSLLEQAQEKQMMSFFMVYYVGNLIATNLYNTGAFEVTYNEKLVWSKLTEGGLPTWPHLLSQMKAAGAA